MMKSDYPRIEIDDLAAVIRESIQKQKNGLERTAVDSHSGEPKAQFIPELKLQPDFQPRPDDRYHINDLLQFHDRAFLDAAYRAILKRTPAEAEFLCDRKRLHDGRVNKIDLLAAIRFSPEGRAKKVQLDGLAVPALIRRLERLPLLGYAINLGVAFLRLPKQVRDQRQFAAYLIAQNQQLSDFVNDVSARVVACRDEVSRLAENLSNQADVLKSLSGEQQTIIGQQNDLDTRFKELDQGMTGSGQKIDALENRIEVNKEVLLGRIETEVGLRVEMRQSISEKFTSVQSKLHAEIERLALGVQHARAILALQTRNADAMAAPAKSVSHVNEPVEQASNELDALYSALEDRFRGSRAEIKEQSKRYLPYVTKMSPVIDLGCGRGEWLEILTEAGIKARGVDKNRTQLEQCRANGLDVIEDDFIDYLRNMDDASVGAVTGFHIIEHLSIESLVRLLNEVLRVLRPNGVVIFETPNPENVLVGSNFFYLDPTHRHPLPSQLMEFLFQSRGFHPVEVLNLHPWESGRLDGEGELVDRLNYYFYGPMDYAIVGWKVGS